MRKPSLPRRLLFFLLFASLIVSGLIGGRVLYRLHTRSQLIQQIDQGIAWTEMGYGQRTLLVEWGLLGEFSPYRASLTGYSCYGPRDGGESRSHARKLIASLDLFPEMTGLGVGVCGLQDEDLASVVWPDGLNTLGLRGNPITDKTGIAITKCPNLRKIGLRETGITDATIKALAEISQLELLDIRNCPGVTREAVQQLKAKLPDCEVMFNAD